MTDLQNVPERVEVEINDDGLYCQLGKDLIDFEVTDIPYHKRYQTIDGVRWVMLKEAQREIENLQAQVEKADELAKVLVELDAALKSCILFPLAAAKRLRAREKLAAYQGE